MRWNNTSCTSLGACGFRFGGMAPRSAISSGRENATCSATHAARPSAAMGNMSSRTITVVVVTTAGLSTVGFFWASKLMVQNTFSFITGLDITNPWDAGVAALCAFVFAITLYYINYPEGQLASEGIADRGKGATHAYQRKDS